MCKFKNYSVIIYIQYILGADFEIFVSLNKGMNHEKSHLVRFHILITLNNHLVFNSSKFINFTIKS